MCELIGEKFNKHDFIDLNQCLYQNKQIISDNDYDFIKSMDDFLTKEIHLYFKDNILVSYQFFYQVNEDHIVSNEFTICDEEMFKDCKEKEKNEMILKDLNEEEREEAKNVLINSILNNKLLKMKNKIRTDTTEDVDVTNKDVINNLCLSIKANLNVSETYCIPLELEIKDKIKYSEKERIKNNTYDKYYYKTCKTYKINKYIIRLDLSQKEYIYKLRINTNKNQRQKHRQACFNLFSSKGFEISSKLEDCKFNENLIIKSYKLVAITINNYSNSYLKRFYAAPVGYLISKEWKNYYLMIGVKFSDNNFLSDDEDDDEENSNLNLDCVFNED